MKQDSGNKAKTGKLQLLARLVFSAAVLFTLVLVVMGITGTHWPKWLLALTTVF